MTPTASATSCADSIFGRLTSSRLSAAIARTSAAKCVVVSALTRTMIALVVSFASGRMQKLGDRLARFRLARLDDRVFQVDGNGIRRRNDGLANSSGRDPGTNSLLRMMAGPDNTIRPWICLL